MKKQIWATGAVLLLTLALTACGGEKEGSSANGTSEANPTTATEANAAAGSNAGGTDQAAQGTRTIQYLGKSYEVPANVERIVITGAMEAMEDALVLDVHPVGAITYSGAFPERFAAITDGAESIGEKTQPNFETILQLKPDLILGSTKFPEDVQEQLVKIAPTILVSHQAVDWEDNLRLLAEVTGKQEAAEQAIQQYKSDLEGAKATLTEKLGDQTVMAIRIRTGKLFIYPESVFFNPILYGDLGLKVPAEVSAAKAQEEITIEQLATINPDQLFIQFAADENKETATALDEFLSNPIVKNVAAVKNDKVYVNVIDPLSEGGPAWSRIEFLKAALERLSE
ncbi:ABC transporter substrate-binding protein [Paenibacillus sp. MB22_1]|uniref:ABC transporter substrate-binding protein n=1 Tax=Paenibacillus sp. MB22_1 TaxID=3383121 RepID=UPI0039A276D5